MGIEDTPNYQSQYFWIGHDKYNRRDEAHVMSDVDWIHKYSSNLGPEKLPRFIIPNPLTGKPAPRANGVGQSYACDNAVKEARHIIVEFDNLPMTDQLAFVGGVLNSGTMKVVSVVHSGNKSLHLLVRVEDDYNTFRTRLQRYICSAPDPRHRADAAVLHTASLTRLAGALRPDTGNLQYLLYAN